MKVYLFDDYLKTINKEPLNESNLICEVSTITSFPHGLVKVQGRLARPCMISGGDLYIEFVGALPKKDSINLSENITCPHCGNKNTDSWECGDSDESLECGSCKSIFSYERNVEVTYSSRIVERNDNIFNLA